MSAPDWRAVFIEAIRSAPADTEKSWFASGADAILAAIAARGYRLHRDHDMKQARRDQYTEGWRCTRCGHWDTDLGMPTMSCEDRA